MRTLTVLKSLVIVGIGTTLAACSPSNEKHSAPEEIRLSKLDVNRYPVTKTVCDPMGGGEPDPRSNVGLKAELYWLNPGQATPTKTSDIISAGKKSDRNVFFSQVITPTRKFDKGFNNDLGEPVRDDQGNKLIEYFALRFKTVLRLAPDQEEGLYELALLSDDGSVLKVRGADGNYSKLVDNDGDHETRLKCGAPLVQFNRDTEILAELDYYQGPRHHIALIPLIRKVVPKSDGTFPRDVACGQQGNNYWFNENTSEPRKPYTDLLARGWRPLTKENYALPLDSGFNPCKDGETPQITNFRITDTSAEGFTVQWDTNIPATSQIVATELPGGEQTLSVSDNVLRTKHSVTINGLKHSTDYALQAISISDTYGKGMTAPIFGRTMTPAQ